MQGTALRLHLLVTLGHSGLLNGSDSGSVSEELAGGNSSPGTGREAR